MRNLITTYLQVSSNSYNFVGMNITINVNTMKKFLLIVAAMLLLIPFANAKSLNEGCSTRILKFHRIWIILNCLFQKFSYGIFVKRTIR